jgi:hypothetical protein
VSEERDPALARRTLAAVIACLDLLDRDWDGLSDRQRHEAVTLALEAGRRVSEHGPAEGVPETA